MPAAMLLCPPRLLACLVLLWSLSAADITPAQAKLRVVATLPDLAALAAEVGGEHVSVVSLLGPHQDPHFVDPRPSLMVRLHQADLLVSNGLELEVGWLPRLVVGARNAAIQSGGAGHLDASSCIRPLEVPVRADRARGDVHPGGNPHFLRDPRAAAAVVRALGEQMAALDAGHAADYRARAQTLAAALQRFGDDQTRRFASLPAAKRAVVPYHRSLLYLREWLGLTAPIAVEPLPGVAPTPGHVAKVLGLMRANGPKLIVQESYYPKKTSETLARLGGGALVVVSGGTDFDRGHTYLQTARETADALYVALSR